MILKGLIVAFIVSQSSWILMYALGSNPILLEPINILMVGSVFIPTFAYILYKLLPPSFTDENGKVRKRNLFYYMCCVFAWSCTIDTISGLEAMDVIDGYFDFYFEKAEPYLGSPFGVWIDLWDGTVHFALYLILIYKYDNGQDYSRWGLYWFGSMLAGMFCLIIGAMTGSYGDTLRPPILLNLPYIVLPFYAAKHLLDLHRNGIRSAKDNKAHSHGFNVWNLVLLAGIVFSVCVLFLRGLVAFGSPLPFVRHYAAEYEPYILEPGKFGAMHCVFNMVYCIPIFIALACHVVNGSTNSKSAELLALILSGALAQGEFFHLKAATYDGTPLEYRVEKNFEVVAVIAIIPIIVAHLLLIHFLITSAKPHAKMR